MITYPEAIMEKVISGSGLEKHTLHIRKGEKLSISFINEILHEYGFERVEFVYEPGQYSIRGSIIDIFSFSNEDPYRIDFFGDTVDSIRTFDIEDQISKEALTRISIIPNIQEGLLDEKRVSLFEFLNKKAVVAAQSFEYVTARIKALHNEATGRMGDVETSDMIISGGEFKTGIESFINVESDCFHVSFALKSGHATSLVL